MRLLLDARHMQSPCLEGVIAMERKKASYFPQELLNMFDQYVHGDINRRQFLEGANKFAAA